jgi:hypothetical protein
MQLGGDGFGRQTESKIPSRSTSVGYISGVTNYTGTVYKVGNYITSCVGDTVFRLISSFGLSFVNSELNSSDLL